MTTALISRWVILAGMLTQTSSYTLVSPKIFSQSLQPSSRTWSNIVPYPFRTYQPSIPLQYMRYYGDPYYPNSLQNPDYYFTPDTYDDGDYYSNILYYLPAGRRSPYYEPTVMDPVDDESDYDDDLSHDDGVSKSQKDWWLEKNVSPNEVVDIRPLNRIDRIGSYHNTKNILNKIEPKTTSKNARKNAPKNRFAGIDGFGRKKDQEHVYANHRPSAKQDERSPVYGRPVHYERKEDTDVKDLKSLLKDQPKSLVMDQPTKNDKKVPAEFSLRNWENGFDKRSKVRAPMFESKENSANKDKSMKPTALEFYIYDEGGQVLVPQNNIVGNEWKDQVPEQQTSVFDTLKTLLTLEDIEDSINGVGQDSKTHQLFKRKPPAYKPSTQMKNKPSNKDRSRAQQSSSTVVSSSKNGEQAITSSPGSRTIKRSVPAEAEGSNDSKSYQSKDDSSVLQLRSVFHPRS